MALSPSTPRLPCGALSAMPFLIINLGAEMLYILQQRLRAQSIEEARTKRILGVVLASLLQPSFVEELFRPREAYSVRATRIVFERIAHASVMRLNKQSMDKLFDLMAMGVKLQLLASPDPPSLLVITQTHLNGMRDIAMGDDGLVALLADATRRCSEIYARMCLGELYSLKQHLLRFFQDRDVKVSLFLEENTQRADGVIVLPLAGPVPRGYEVPGTVRYFDNVTGKVISGTQKISGDFPSIFLPALPISEGPVDASSTPTKLGANLYLKERKKDITSTPNTTVASSASNIQSTNKEKEKRNIINTVDDDDTDGGKQDERNSTSGINGINSPTTLSSHKRNKDESESKLSPVTSEMTLASLATRRSEESIAGVNLLASLLGTSSTNASNDLTDIEIVDLFGENGGGILASEVTEGSYSVNGTNSLQVFGAKKNELNTMSGMLERFGFDDNDGRDERKATDSNTSRLVRGSTERTDSGGSGGGEGESKGENNSNENDDLLDLMDSL
jgi:hypothetical protein